MSTLNVKTIGIITNNGVQQAHVNTSHAEDIGSVLSKKYTIHYYDVSKIEDIERLVFDKKNNNLDLVLNNAAGKKGGDGTVEGLLSLLKIPFVGSDTLATAVAFDKKTTKAVLSEAGVPTIKGITVSYDDYRTNPSLVVQNVSTSIGYPVIVKASQGSDSIGISLVRRPRRLIPALNRAFKEDSNLIIEEFITRIAEVTCTVMGSGSKVEALYPIERLYDTELFNADMSATYQVADCDKNTIESIKRYACIAHQALGCDDYSRSDFLIDQSGNILFLEINAHAGLGKGRSTDLAAFKTKKWTYDELIEHIIKLSILRTEINL